MPGTPTVLNSTAQTNSSAVSTSGSVSPAANALLVVIAGTTAGSGGAQFANPTIADTFSGGSLTWTRQVQFEQASTSSAATVIFTAQTGATPGSGTVSVTWPTASTRRVIHVCQVATDFNTTTPVAQVASGGSGPATTLSLTLPGTPAASSLVMGGVVSRGDSDVDATAGANFTELVDTAASTNTNLQVQYDAASATTTVDWSALGTLNAGVAIEIAAAAAGGDDFRVQTLEIGGQLGMTQYQTGGAGLVML